MTKNSIERQSVKSSNIKSCGYNPQDKTLAVEFSDGTVYHYADVGQTEFDDLVSAKSVGSHFHKHIKGVYKFSKPDPDD